MIRVAGTTGGSPAARRLGKLIQTSVGAVLMSSSVAGVRLPAGETYLFDPQWANSARLVFDSRVP